jgi:[ribosomal protein S5]-alanine N-acetyltransferase
VEDSHCVETERLFLRPIRASDLAWFIKVYANPKNMKQIHDGSTLTKKQAQHKVNNFIKDWEEHGFGMWILQEKSTSQFIGYAGFRYFEEKEATLHNQIELGYIINEPYWGKGYASEAVFICVQTGLNQYHLKHILATILPDNTASQKVADKAGLKHSFDIEIDGLVHYVYEAKDA